MTLDVLEAKPMTQNNLGGLGASPAQLPFDLSKGMPILGVPLGEHEAVAVIRVQLLKQLVPDPRLSEDPKRVAEDETLAQYAALRAEVQRAVQGAKAKNAVDFKSYILAGLRNTRPIILPPMTLYHPKKLESVSMGQGFVALVVPYGDFFVAIDGETQRLAWEYATKEFPDALGQLVKVVIHHGKPILDARQGFYDLNTKEVKPNAAVAISMDSVDVATRITRLVMESSDVIRGRVNLQRRSLTARDPELLTISALRTGIVTTVLGAAGLQIGNRSIAVGEKAGELNAETDIKALESAAVDVWDRILTELNDELERRQESVVWAPAVLAGIGILAHRSMPIPPRRDGNGLTVDEVLDLLEGVSWEREAWSGIAGKFTASGRFSVGGPKEFGRAVADALENPDSEMGRQIRGRKEGA